MGAVDVVAGEVDQILHQLAAAAHEGTGHPERLKVPIWMCTGRMNPWAARGRALGPQHPNTVGVVDHQPVAALGSQCCKVQPRALIPSMLEDPFRGRSGLGLTQAAVPKPPCRYPEAWQELAAISCREVLVEPVLPQQMPLPSRALSTAWLGEAAVEQQHRLHPEPVGQRLLQLLVSAAVAGHQGEGAGARAILRTPAAKAALMAVWPASPR